MCTMDDRHLLKISDSDRTLDNIWNRIGSFQDWSISDERHLNPLKSSSCLVLHAFTICDFLPWWDRLVSLLWLDRFWKYSVFQFLVEFVTRHGQSYTFVSNEKYPLPLPKSISLSIICTLSLSSTATIPSSDPVQSKILHFVYILKF